MTQSQGCMNSSPASSRPSDLSLDLNHDNNPCQSFRNSLATFSIQKRSLFLNFSSSCFTNSDLYPTLNQMTQDSLLWQAQATPAERPARYAPAFNLMNSGAWVCSRTCFNKTILKSHSYCRGHSRVDFSEETKFQIYFIWQLRLLCCTYADWCGCVGAHLLLTLHFK